MHNIPRAAVTPTSDEIRVLRHAVDNLCDFDAIVDDRRRDLECAAERLRAAVAARARAIAILQQDIMRLEPAS